MPLPSPRVTIFDKTSVSQWIHSFNKYLFVLLDVKHCSTQQGYGWDLGTEIPEICSNSGGGGAGRDGEK